MSWLKRAAENLHHAPDLREIVLALAEWEAVMAVDLSKLQSDVSAQGAVIQQVQARVAALEAGTGSSADQAAVDELAAAVESNNAVLTTLASS